jgi:hypothetical protein
MRVTIVKQNDVVMPPNKRYQSPDDSKERRIARVHEHPIPGSGKQHVNSKRHEKRH